MTTEATQIGEASEWVGDSDTGLAHLRVFTQHGRAGTSLCGVLMWGASRGEGEGKPRCSMCRDMRDGKLKRWH
jgi:hypothetical protein